jgi:hypothetical protein
MIQLTPLIAAFITGLAGPLLVYAITKYINKKAKPVDLIREAVNVSNLITDSIEEIKEEFEADRVWITQFHNGGNFYPTGKSMAKFSVIYETVNIGIGSIQSMFQNIQVNLFSKSINELQQNGTIQISDYKDPSIATFGLKYIAEDTGCKSGYLFAINSIDGKFIGVLGLDYSRKKTKLGEIQINELLIHAGALGGVIMTHLNQK